MTTQTERVSDERLREMLAGCEGVTPGPWLYRPYEHDDWGMVRGGTDEDGRLWIVATARAGRYIGRDGENEHRVAKTDPFGENASHIAACDPDTIRSLVSELLALRAAVDEVRDLSVGSFRDNEAKRALSAVYMRLRGVAHV